MRHFRSSFLIGLIAVASTCFADRASAGTNSWQFSVHDYFDWTNSLPPLLSGTLVTEDSLNDVHQYNILSVSGFYGSDPIIGLSDRPNYHGYSPDNAISFNGRDWAAPMGCQGWTYYPIFPIATGHFSCAGASFETTVGVVNVSFGGATETVVGYDNGPYTIARSQFIMAVPGPQTLSLMAIGLALLVGFAKRRQA